MRPQDFINTIDIDEDNELDMEISAIDTVIADSRA